jgi:hypothetical protein
MSEHKTIAAPRAAPVFAWLGPLAGFAEFGTEGYPRAGAVGECPLCSPKWTFVSGLSMSALCQKQTSQATARHLAPKSPGWLLNPTQLFLEAEAVIVVTLTDNLAVFHAHEGHR